MTRKEWLSMALGLGLAVSTTAPVFAQSSGNGGQGSGSQSGQSGTTAQSASAGQDGQMNGQAMAQQALRDFWNYTERNWASQGYSSANEMRQALGNAQTDWLTQTTAMAGGQTFVTALNRGVTAGQAGNSTSGQAGNGSGTGSAGGGAGSGANSGGQGGSNGGGRGSDSEDG